MKDVRHDFEHYRASLMLWATCQLPHWLRGKLDPADLVQQTLMEAIASQDRMAHLSEHGKISFIRRILSNNLIDTIRRFGRSKTEISPEDGAASSVRLADWLAADHSSPSERAERNERFERLASALAKLPDAQRIAIEMRYLQKLKLADIAQLLNRSENSISRLLHRAVIALRFELTDFKFI